MISILTLVLISIITIYWFYKLFFFVLIKPIQLKRLLSESGVHKDGRIVNSIVSGKLKRYSKVKITVAFDNFAGTEITKEFSFTDTKPELNRYRKGNRVQLVLTDNFKNPVRLVDGKLRQNLFIKGFALLIFIGYCIGVYFMILRIIELTGGTLEGALSLTNQFVLPLIGGIYFAVIVFITLLFRKLGLIESDKSARENYNLLYHGESVSADILEYKATGTKINDNPVVNFKYKFNARFSNDIEGSDSLIVSQLDTGSLSNQTQKKVMFLPEKPEINRLTESLVKTQMPGCIQLVVTFLAFVFSCVVMGMFIGMVLV